MKCKKRLIVLTSLFVMMFSFMAAQPEVKKSAVESIINSPSSYDNEVVKVEGLVTTYIPSSANSTAYYLLKGDFGGVIRVNTSGSTPITNQKYCVTGVVYVFTDNKGNVTKYFISEQSKYEGVCNDFPSIDVNPSTLNLGKVEVNSSKDGSFTISNKGRANLNLFEINISNRDVFELEMPGSMVIGPGSSAELKVIYTPKDVGTYSGILTIKHNANNELNKIMVYGSTPPIIWWKQPLVLVIIGAGLLLIVLLIILLVNRNKPKTVNYSKSVGVHSHTRTETMPNTVMQSYETVIVPKTIPMTLKVFPGEFEFTSGADAGKKFKMPGYQNENGLIITVGREKPSAEMAQYHIQLKENTVGRKQAEFILKDRIVYLKNLGTTNYSVVDGKEILPNISVEIKSGSIIKFGDVSLKYNS